MASFLARAKNAFNAFIGSRDPTEEYSTGSGSYIRPDRRWSRKSSERSTTMSVLNRIAVDAASMKIRHVRIDENDEYLEDINSDLNYCFKVSANLDQTPRALRQDIFLTMLEEGHAAVVPVICDQDPRFTDSYDPQSLRVGTIVEWKPRHVRVNLYNEITGRREEITLPKRMVAIAPNPFYDVMNAPNSTMQRLSRKLNLLDVIDEQSGSGKLDMIIQLPYVVKTPEKRAQAEARRKDIERQLSGSKYGIAYTDGTERITQLNRSVENNLMNQIEFLTSMYYSQLGIEKGILDGTATDQVMQNYQVRIIEPIVSSFTDEAKRKWLSKTAITQGQSIMFFQDQLKMVPISLLADLADKLRRNEVVSSNEIRSSMGMKPSDNEKANELSNPNINQSSEEGPPASTEEPAAGFSGE